MGTGPSPAFLSNYPLHQGLRGNSRRALMTRGEGDAPWLEHAGRSGLCFSLLTE